MGSMFPMAPFTHDVKKIKGATNKNGDIDVTCKQALRPPQNDSIETTSAPNVCLGSNIYRCSNFKVMFPKSQSVKQAIFFYPFPFKLLTHGKSNNASFSPKKAFLKPNTSKSDDQRQKLFIRQEFDWFQNK